MARTNGPSSSLALTLDRAAGPLATQIADQLRAGILDGRIAPGARLPSWRDLAVQLGVARGTVRSAYERLIDEALVASHGAAGTRVVERPPLPDAPEEVTIDWRRLGLVPGFARPPLSFQIGVPAQDAFPFKTWSRLVVRAAREAARAPTTYPDPRGEIELRTEIASYLAIARGLACVPDQVIVTGGFRAGLGLAISALHLAGATAWTEDPGFPLTRAGLDRAGMRIVAVPVDAEGIDVTCGRALAPRARLAVVTPGQQAPTGVVLSPGRRDQLLQWAQETDAWIIEDDYLSELQLTGRARPALASHRGGARVIHIGSFSKTLTPALGLGYVVAPLAVAERFAETAAWLAPSPGRIDQLAVAAFMRAGHFLRHLRRMKRLYAERRDALVRQMAAARMQPAMAGLAVLLHLDAGVDDVALARQAFAEGLAPIALSPWYVDPARRRPGLLLGVSNVPAGKAAVHWRRLRELIAQAAGQDTSAASRRGVIRR